MYANQITLFRYQKTTFYSGRTLYALGTSVPTQALVPTNITTSYSNANNILVMNLGSLTVYNKDYVTTGSNTVLLGRSNSVTTPTSIDISFITDPIIKVVTTS